jgi:hypothetical protein
MNFQLVMNAQGVPEAIACLATQRDVLAELPRSAVGVDLEPLAAGSIEQIRSAFDSTTGGAVAQEVFRIQPR